MMSGGGGMRFQLKTVLKTYFPPIILIGGKKRGEIQKGAQGTLFDSFYKKLLPLSHTES